MDLSRESHVISWPQKSWERLNLPKGKRTEAGKIPASRMGREWEPARQRAASEQEEIQVCEHPGRELYASSWDTGYHLGLCFSNHCEVSNLGTNDVLDEYVPKYKIAPNRDPSGSRVDQVPSPEI